ncbi:MAG: type pilus assembly protein PilC, partial [Cryptosporangiaceae bacterium]|nr:type pilus assembly protein PilC [Cryptosporangiaceae bacterium]
MALTKTFDYKTADIYGKRSKGRIEAPNATAAAAMLKQQGVTPLDIAEAGQGLNREIKLPGMGNRTTLKDLSVFARQFATLTSSGMSLLRALAVLEEQTERPSLRKAVHEVRIDIEGGLSLSAALGRHPKVFPLLMVAMIRSGETGGFLDNALEQIAANLEKDANLRGKIKSTMTYPVIVLLFSLIMITGVLIFIVPIFEQMFKNLGGKMPAITQFLVTASHNVWWLGPLFLTVAITGT